jgi:hypothetical protein
MMLALDAPQRRYQAIDQFGVRRSFDDRESVAADPVGMGLNLRVRQHLCSLGFSTLCRVFSTQDSAQFLCLGGISAHAVIACDKREAFAQGSKATKQSIYPRLEVWIASRSLSSGAHSRDPLARNDEWRDYRVFQNATTRCAVVGIRRT